MSSSDAMDSRTRAERAADHELVVSRTFNAPASLVFEAWTRADLFQRWWVPKSLGITLLSCDLDVRVGGTYRLAFSHPASPDPIVFHGHYLEVNPPSRLVWSNEEAGDDGQITTVTFEEQDGSTLLVMRERYPSREALDEAIASGSTSGDMEETFSQLDELLAAERATDAPAA
ncbi:MAG: SRPBCC family protein [Dehalococcoidia bacterium]